MRSSDWSSDVCSSDLDVSACEPVEKRGFSRIGVTNQCNDGPRRTLAPLTMQTTGAADLIKFPPQLGHTVANHSPVRFNLGFARSTKKAETAARSEEHTSELQSLMRIQYALFCLTKKTKSTEPTHLQ